MAFVCKFQLNNGAIDPTSTILFLKFIDSSFGEFHAEPIALAEVILNGNHAYIYSNCPCFPSTKGDLKFKDKIDSNTIIGYFAAEGEDIPYSKPYAVVVEGLR